MNARIGYIDGLRGLAVLAVVLFHAGVHDTALAASTGSPLAFLVRQGCHGVDLFFILSGFCLAYPALARLRAAGRAKFGIAAYAARRLIRIVPPYYAAIAVFVAVGGTLLAAGVPLPEPIAREALSFGGVVKQALFLDRDNQFVDASFWTLAIEFRWYFVFPLLLWVWNASPRTFGALAIAIVAVQATRMQSVDLFFLPFFMLGIVAADVHARFLPVRRLALFASAAMLALALWSTAGAGWYFDDRGPFWGVAMFCFVVAAGSTPLLRRALSGKWIAAIGTASYGIYLIHEPVVALIERTAAPEIGATAAFALAVLGALALGTLFSRIAERPFLDSPLRARLIARLEPAVATLCGRLSIRDVIDLRRTVSAAQEREAIPA